MTWSNSNTVSRINIDFVVGGKGKLVLEFVRHLSPSTFSNIIKIMPISGRLHFLDRKLAYVETGLTVGAEKQKAVYKRGDLAFMVSNGSICIVLQDIRGINMNHIGHCVDDPILLESSDSSEIIFINRTP